MKITIIRLEDKDEVLLEFTQEEAVQAAKRVSAAAEGTNVCWLDVNLKSLKLCGKTKVSFEMTEGV